MHLNNLNNLLVLTGLLSTLSFADPIPQSPEQTTAAVSELSSYILALATDSAFLSFASDIATNPGLSSSIVDWEASVSSVTKAGRTPTSGFIQALPTEAQSLFSSIYSVEFSILTQNGFATSTSSSKAAAPTQGVGSKVKVAGAVAAGFVGALVAM